MKAILISIKPQHVANILNGLKTIEIRKHFPKDYVGWVYIYVTRNKPYLYHERTNIGSYDFYELTPYGVQDLPNYKHAYTVGHDLNGKVVARFWCDKVEEIEFVNEPKYLNVDYQTKAMLPQTLETKSCLSFKELDDYLQGKDGYAIHVAKLEIFYEPKELAQHTHDNSSMFYTKKWDKVFKTWRIGALTRAPQSYCFVEVDL